LYIYNYIYISRNTHCQFLNPIYPRRTYVVFTVTSHCHLCSSARGLLTKYFETQSDLIVNPTSLAYLLSSPKYMGKGLLLHTNWFFDQISAEKSSAQILWVRTFVSLTIQTWKREINARMRWRGRVRKERVRERKSEERETAHPDLVKSLFSLFLKQTF